MRRYEIKEVQKIISEYKPNISEITNGNTPSPLSPTSVGSQVGWNFALDLLLKADLSFRKRKERCWFLVAF